MEEHPMRERLKAACEEYEAVEVKPSLNALARKYELHPQVLRGGLMAYGAVGDPQVRARKPYRTDKEKIEASKVPSSGRPRLEVAPDQLKVLQAAMARAGSLQELATKLEISDRSLRRYFALDSGMPAALRSRLDTINREGDQP